LTSDAAPSTKRCRDGGSRPGARPARPGAPQRHALFLDVDGTLLSIAAQPDGVHVSAELCDLLERLQHRLEGAVALISGRSLEDLDRLFAPLVLPAAGVHGLERRDSRGYCHVPDETDGLAALRQPLHDFAARHEGLLLEDKGSALALHYRAAPERRGEAEGLVQDLLAKAPSPLHLTHGKMVLEIRAGGADKGTAIAAFMAEAPFAGRIPVFIGDDVTDEDGFRSVNRLGGLSIRVGDSAATAASYSLPDEAAVQAWLNAWLIEEEDELMREDETR
jgi:trehalose 6-phosphate phosphatase